MKPTEVDGAVTGRRATCALTPQLIGLEGKRVEVVDCDGQTRRFWVGKSSSFIPIHLEIPRRNSSGGCGVYGAPFREVRVVMDGKAYRSVVHSIQR
jgi:predicted membrane metal-binding protein